MSFLGMCCSGCDRGVVVDCPTLSDLPKAQAEIDALGWVVDRRHRSFCSLACGTQFLAAEAEQAATPPPPPSPLRTAQPRQADLFGASR